MDFGLPWSRVALRGRRDGDRDLGLGRAAASVPRRHALATGRPDDLRPVPGTGRPGASTTSPTCPARSPIPPATRGSALRGRPDHHRRPRLGAMPADSIGPSRCPTGSRSGWRVHRVARRRDRQQREPGAARRAGRRAGRAAAGGDARRARVAAGRVFAAVAEEVAQLLRVEDTTIFRYEDDWTATVVADRGDRDVPLADRKPDVVGRGERDRAGASHGARRPASTTSRSPPGRSPITRATRASARPSAARSWSTVGSGAP